MGSLENAANETKTSISATNGTIINLDMGDPTVFEQYWKKIGEKCTVVIPGGALMSYFSDIGNACWFLEKELDDAIRKLHRAVGNAVTDGRYIVVGTGSTQLLQAAVYALCLTGGSRPFSIVCAAPYYSCYKEVIELMNSEKCKWEGDVHSFDNKDQPYIEIITSPNNPDGVIRQSVFKSENGKYIHDLAYYWPHYTPITHQLHYDLMLFTFSKTTGHAGSRIGWALIKDEEVARMMTKFIQISTVGVSKESQLRAAKILGAVTESFQRSETSDSENFFEYAQSLMQERWKKLRQVVHKSEIFSLPKYPKTWCNFSRKYEESYPAFAWVKCKEDIDCEGLLRANKIMTRGGERFGVNREYARISMLSQEETFNNFLERLSAIQGINKD